MLVDIGPFVAQMRAENEILRKNGAKPQAEAREALLAELESFFTEFEEQVLEPKEAASIAGVHEDTVYRARQRGEIGDESGKIRLSDLPVLKSKARRRSGMELGDRSGYNVLEHFQSTQRST